MKDPEIKAIEDANNLLSNLSEEARHRVLSWLVNKFDWQPGHFHRTPSSASENGRNQPNTTSAKYETELPDFTVYPDFRDLFNECRPQTESEKVILAATYLQEKQKATELTGRSINNVLKRIGHGVKNITSAIGVLIERKPSLVVQTKKDSLVQQAQKRYRVTLEGLHYVREMMSKAQSNFN